MTAWGISDRAAAVHESALVWDTHAGFSPFPDLDLGFLDRWIRAGASYLCVNVGYDTVMTPEETIRCTAHYRHWFEARPDRFILVETAAEVDRAKREGKLAVAFDLEGANALDDNVEWVGLYYRLGVRHMNLAYNTNNAFGGGCHDVDVPLTPLGRATVAEMSRVGMLLDCSHTGYRTSMEAMELSTKPTIFSHSNPRALHDHGRNIRDDQIRACAATGGVVGINGVSTFLDGNTCDAVAIVRHIDYVADLVGVDHVGLGIDTVTDPDELPKLQRRYPNAWPGYANQVMVEMHFAQPEELPRITEALLDRGYGDDDVRKIMGGNFLRVARAVWQ